MEWSDFMTERQTLAVFSSVSHSIIRHSKYAALILKDAIVDYFRDNKGSRPSIDTINPDVWFNLHIQKDRAVISLAVSGGSLHRRGYRIEAGEAPMQETVAATIIRMSGWDGATPLYDPMCGSGTLLFEALMHYTRLPAAVLRDDFGFRHLPDFKRGVWRTIRESAREQLRPLPRGLIRGSDISPLAIRQAGTNARQLEQGEKIEFSQNDYRQLQGLENSTIICNPPYGLRLKQGGDITDFYRELGDFLKNSCQGATAYIYFGKRELLKSIGLRASWKRPLVSGSLDGRLAKFEMF
jgi:putative N6-adenine-specific DNA methylase